MSTLDIDMEEMGQYPLLSAKEEAELAEGYEQGKAARYRLAQDPPTDPDDQRELQNAAAEREKGRRELIRCNLHLVVSFAKKHAGNGLASSDLFQDRAQRLREDSRGLTSARLWPREQEMLWLRYGLADHQSRTLEQVAEQLGVTRERVRQTKNARCVDCGMPVTTVTCGDIDLDERTVMAEQKRAIVCQRCGMGFVVTENYLNFLAKWGNELVVPVQCLSCFWKGGPLPKQEGHIKWFSKRKRYGFIVTQEQEIFFHQNQLVDSDSAEPAKEQPVRFHTRYTSKGQEALNVELITN